jgi:hypothetical protein
MKKYNKEIANQMIDNEWKFIKNTPQPEMFGSGRFMKHPEAGCTIDTYGPSTLSTGDPIKNYKAGSFWGDLGHIAKEAAPIAIPLMMAAGLEKKKRGRPKKEIDGGKFNFINALKDVGRKVAPIAKEVAVPVIKEVAKDSLKSMLTSGAGIEKKKRGRPKKQVDGGKFNFLNALKDVGREVGPIAKDIAVPIIKDVAKDSLKSMLTSGAGIKKSRKPNKRNELIKVVMEKYNISLPKASKLIKTHNSL